jgi:Holliday junction resolvase RusA-like endonuclease
MARRAAYPSHVQAALDAAVEAQDTRPRAARIDITLSFPPSLNNAYPTIVTKTGKLRRVLSPRAAEFKTSVRQTVRLHLIAINRRPPLPPYRLSVRAFPPKDGQRHDLTNAFKLVEDALMDVIGGDDDDVVHVEGDKEPRDAWPRIVVTLEGAGGE